MISDLDLVTPAAEPTRDPALTWIGRVYAVSPSTRTVQVGAPDGTTVLSLPAQPGRYRLSASAASGLARVLVNPRTGRPTLVLGPVDPVAPSSLAVVSATGSGTVTVTWNGSATVLPAIPSTYTVGQTAWVDTDDWGTPFLVRGPSSIPAPAPEAPPDVPDTGGTVQARTQIGPQWSGTWRQTRWDNWNVSRFGGRSDVYQGSGYGSGPLVGLVTFGDQLANLGALSIDAISVSARRNDWADAGAAALTVQGSPHGSQPGGVPSGTGSTATTNAVGKGGWASTQLAGDVREGMRTGAIKGLVAVGGAASGWGGTGTPGSMVLDVLFTRPA